MRRAGLVMVVAAALLALTAGVALAAVRYGTGGNDVLSGTAYADQMYGYGGGDLLMHGAGGEWTPSYTAAPAPTTCIRGLRPRDRQYGGAGNDNVDAADGRRDYVDCGLGRDSLATDSVDEVRDCEVPALTR